MIWKCQGPRGADINVCASLNPNPTAHRQLSSFIMGKITPELVNVHTAICKAYFSCFQHLFEYLQLANKCWKLKRFGVACTFSGAKMKAKVGSGHAGLPVEHNEFFTRPPNTVQGLSSLPQQFRWWHTRGKNKLQPQILESFLSPATCFAFLGWYRWQRPQDSSHHCIDHAVFLQLISCYTTGVSQSRITGMSLQNRSSLYTKGWCRQVYFGLLNWGALCRFKLQVKSKYSGISKPLYYTRSVYIKKFSWIFFQRLQAGFALGTSFSPVEYLLIYKRVSEKRIRHCLFNEDF